MSAPEPFVGSVSVYRHRGPVVLALVAWALACLSFALLFALPSEVAWIGLFALLGVFVFPAMATSAQGRAVVGVKQPWSKGTIVVEHESVRATVATRSFSFPLADVSSAWIEPTGLATKRVVVLTKRDWVIEAVLSQTEAKQLVARVGFDRPRVVRIPIGASTSKPGARAVGALFGVLLALFSLPILVIGLLLLANMTLLMGLAGLAVIGLAIALLVGVGRALRDTLLGSTLTIGAEGFQVRRALTSRFYPFSKLVDLAPAHRKLGIVLDDGKTREVPTSGPIEAQIVSSLLKAARDRAATSAPERALTMLDRGGRELAKWKKDVRDFVSDAGYRDPGVTTEELVRVASAPLEPPDRRVAAALVLSRVADDADRQRVRVAVDACANDAMKRVLTIALEEAEIDERALARASRTKG